MKPQTVATELSDHTGLLGEMESDGHSLLRSAMMAGGAPDSRAPNCPGPPVKTNGYPPSLIPGSAAARGAAGPLEAVVLQVPQ